MKTINLNIPRFHATLLDELVNENLYPNRNEAIRQAIRDLLKFHGKI